MSISQSPHARCMRRRCGFALVLCAAFAAQAQAPLSLDQALRLAQERSMQLVAQDAGAGAARAMAVAAAQRPDPTFKAGLNSVPIDGPDRYRLTRDSFTMLSFGVSQELTRDDKLKARAARFERDADVAVASRALALANLRRDTALTWLTRHYQERMRDLLRQQRNETALQVEAAEAAYRGGRGAQADVFAARTAVAQIDERAHQADLAVAGATTRLARWVGVVAEQSLAAAPEMNTLRLQSGALESHVAHHPQVLLALRQEAAARAQADIAQSNQRADWSVELSYSQRGAAYSNMASLNLSIPLQWDRANRQQRELSSALAVVEQMRAQTEEITREHLADVRVALQQWQGNRERLGLYDRSLIPLAGERTQAHVAAYRGGGGTLAAVLEARRLDLDMRMERLRLEAETAALWAQLEYLFLEQGT